MAPTDARIRGARRGLAAILTGACTATGMAAIGVIATGNLAPTRAEAATSFDADMFQLVNQDRAQAGLAPLAWDNSTQGLAEAQPFSCGGQVIRGRAQDMLDRNYFAHIIPGCNENVFNVMQQMGIPFTSAGENVGWESGILDPSQAAQYLNTAYMNSPEHRANILNPSYTSVAIGGAATATGQSWSGAGDAHGSVIMSSEIFRSGSAPGSTVGAPTVTSSFSVLPPSAPSPDGYWLAGADGSVYDFAAPGDFGGEGGGPLNQPIVGMASMPSGCGYWLVARDGGIFPHGCAVGYGSTGGIHLNQPIVGMASTADGHGYWLVASDGGIFPFGDAFGYGSTGGIHLNQPIVGMSPTGSGQGYWLVASDGGIFPFGDAFGYGSTGGIHLNQPIVGMATTPDGHGYWLVARDGGIFTFGNAGGYGSTGAMRLNQPIVGMAATHSGHGYWLVAGDGGIFTFGDAAGHGSAGGLSIPAPVTAMAAG